MTMVSHWKMRPVFLVLSWLATLAVTQPVTASELFLIPEKSVISMKSEPLIRLVGETFIKSDPPIARASLLDVTVTGNGRVNRLRDSAWYDEAECTVTSISTLCGQRTGAVSKSHAVSILKYVVDNPGTYVVGVSTRPQTVTVSSAELAAHLRQSGAPGVLETVESADSVDPLRERQSSYAHAIVQVSEQRTSDYARVLGHPVEITLDQNPYDRNAGDPIAFRVLRNGKPASDQLVMVGYRDLQTVGSARVNLYELRTDSNGRASFLLTSRGLWYVSMLDMRKSADKHADYDATWSTVTFRTK
jgi:hypothetical protein